MRSRSRSVCTQQAHLVRALWEALQLAMRHAISNSFPFALLYEGVPMGGAEVEQCLQCYEFFCVLSCCACGLFPVCAPWCIFCRTVPRHARSPTASCPGAVSQVLLPSARAMMLMLGLFPQTLARLVHDSDADRAALCRSVCFFLLSLRGAPDLRNCSTRPPQLFSRAA